MLRRIIKRIPFSVELYAVYRRIFNITGDDGTQSGELKVLKKLIKTGSPKYVVDIGAHDGTTISNSSYFIKKGWRGILIEPSPVPFKALQGKYRDNKKVVCINAACSDKDGYADLYFGSDGGNSMMSTLCKDQNDWFERARSSEAIKVKVQRINDLLIQYNFPQNFSLLLIDTEGMDYEVLRGLDFNTFRPGIIVTEEYKWNEEKHLSKYKLLEENQYRFHSIVGCNSIWISNSN